MTNIQKGIKLNNNVFIILMKNTEISIPMVLIRNNYSSFDILHIIYQIIFFNVFKLNGSNHYLRQSFIIAEM